MREAQKSHMIVYLKKVVKFFREFSDKMNDRHTAACAAQAAFFILLSVVPIVTLILAIATYLPFTQQDVLDLLMGFIPNEFESYVADIIADLYGRAGTTVISVSVVATLWSASKGFAALRDGFDSMYKVKQEHGYVKSRVIAIGYTILFIIVFALVMSVYVTVSHYYKGYIRELFDMNSLIGDILMFVRFILGWLLFYIFILMIYVVLPSGFGLPVGKEEQMNLGKRMKSQATGAAFCSVAWLLISKVLVLYIQHFPNLSVMYGSLAGIVIAMLWLYFCMYSLFIGAIINCLLSKGYLTRVKKMLQ